MGLWPAGLAFPSVCTHGFSSQAGSVAALCEEWRPLGCLPPCQVLDGILQECSCSL
jgi:hypothetical protein